MYTLQGQADSLPHMEYRNGMMRTLLIVLLASVVMGAPSADKPSGLAGTVNAPPEAPEHVQPTEPARDRQAAELRIRVAQLMLVTLQGLNSPSAEDRELLSKHPLGGVVVPSAVDPRGAAEYVASLRSLPLEQRAKLPLFIGTDLYGLLRRGPASQGGLVAFPSLLAIAASRDAASTERLGTLVAADLAAMGFNLNLGPSLELAPTLADAVGTVHSFGSNAAFTAEAAGALIDALAEGDILAMPMGFPGGGENRVAKAPATLLTPRARLAQQDLLPFARAIEHKVPLIHVANTLVPTIDPNSRPASLSPEVMRKLLREEMKFEGVIVAGPMDSPDIQRICEPWRAAVEAIKAGADMLYWTQPGKHVEKAIEAVARAVTEGAIPSAALDASLDRIYRLKAAADLLNVEPPKPKNAAALEGKNRFQREAYEVERRSITLAKNSGKVLPLTKENSVPVGVTGIVAVEELAEALRKHLKPVVEQPIATAKHTGDIEDFEIQRLTGSGVARTALCVFPNMRKTPGQVQLVHELKQNGARVVVILLGYPKNLAQFSEADAIVLAYCDDAISPETLLAVTDVLVGEAPVAILPSVRPLTIKAGKAEPFNVADVVRTPAGTLPVTITEAYPAGLAASYDATTAIKRVEWDFGDGKRSTDPRAEHAYATAGSYSVTLTVTDK